MIPSEYIKTFLPVHELEEIKPSSVKSVAPISPNDLLLISQVSAYSSKTDNAVVVSKKISYENLMHKLSSDFNITSVKINVDELSNQISQCSTQIESTSAALSNAISLCANALSVHSNELCSQLSTTINDNYIKKYTGSYNTINTQSNNAGTKILTKFAINDGVVSINNNDYAFLSDLIAAKDWQLAYGGIAGDKSKTSYVSFNNKTSYCYEVLSDCYLNCNISAYEDDSYNPLQIWIATNITGNTTSSLYQTLNNPGGFSGKYFYNYYHFTIPIKAFQTSVTSLPTSVIIKYENNSKFNAQTSALFDEYCFYAVPSKSELSGYVKNLITPLNNSESTENVYKIKYDKNTGQITSATSAYYGKATNEHIGLVKVDKNDFFAPQYALKLDSNEFAYVEIPTATTSSVGTIQLNYAYNNTHYSANDGNFLKCGLEKDDRNKGQVFIPEATNDKYGTIKLSTNCIQFGSWSDASYDLHNTISSYVGVNENGQAYVTLPIANGIGIPGLVKTSIADTSEIRIVRNVYVDDNGFAQVNVVNQPSIGLFKDGYTKCIELPLTNAKDIGELIEPVYEFNDNQVTCSEYGNYAFSELSSINGWFMATLIYMGTGYDEYTQDNSYLQIICDNRLVTTINISQIQGPVGKKFCYSTQLGVFKSHISNARLFAAISNANQFGPPNNPDKLYFLIKEMNLNN